MNTMTKTFPDEPIYRYYIKLKDVNPYYMDDYAEEIIPHENKLSGWCSESGRKVVMDRFKHEKGVSFLFVTKEQYYEEYA